jgi:hypothetical protein
MVELYRYKLDLKRDILLLGMPPFPISLSEQTGQVHDLEERNCTSISIVEQEF